MFRLCHLSTALAACALIAGKTFAEEGKLYPGEIVVEHAGIIAPSSDGDKARGFFTIWNGTDDFLYIDGFESNWVFEMTLREPKFMQDAGEARPIKAPKSIPPKSEFVMTEDGFHLAIDTSEPLVAGEAIHVIITFADRDPILVRAKILPFGTKLTEHHHGYRDG